MLCSSCGAENQQGRKFCTECGNALALACHSCGAPIEGTEKFCGECGTPLSQSAASQPLVSTGPASIPTTAGPTAERRLVSVLFADLVGFTTLSEHRDPEETRELLSRYFDQAREVIVRYGGIVEKFIGDAVMAVWGTPVAHEDDAERAVRAGLELVEAVATLGKEVGADDLRLRAGVLTGEAAVTLGAEGQGMVAGDLVNTASRLQSAAAPGTVLVGEATYRAAREAIGFDEAGDHALKGKELPIKAYRALRVIAGHGGFRRAETVEAPFVGRDQELRLLKESLHATGQERSPRLISVMGIGGIGKSRLAWEFFKYIDGVVETIYWHQGRCPAYGDGITFWALGEMVRMRARITETEDPQSARAKLIRTLEQHVTDREERRWIEPRLAHLLGLEEAPGEREELFAAWRTFFERISDNGTTVLIFEDLQWADAGLIDFIEHTLEWARSSPVLIVTLARPEVMERRPTWGAGQRSFTSVHLAPLGDDEMRKLLGGLATGLPDFLVEQVVERSEGVPLYAVEMVRMLVDQGHLAYHEGVYRLVTPPDRLDVPDTLHALIASRLDALEPTDRSLLQDASVLGKTFTLEALAAVRQEDVALQTILQSLVRKELLVIEGDPWSPERGQYGFVQSLIREVAYSTLARPERRRKHLAAASYFETMGDELASVVAAHLIEAQQALPPGSEAEELAARARAALVAAAERAGSLKAHSQAVDYFSRALEISKEPSEQARLLEKAAESAEKAGAHEAAEGYAAESIDAYRNLGDRLGEARAGVLLGTALVMGGRPAIAVERMKDILERVLRPEAEEDVVSLLAGIAGAHMMASEPEPAIDYADQALTGAERLGATRLVTEVLIAKANALQLLGRWLEAIVLLGGAGTLGRKHGFPEEQGAASLSLSNALLLSDPVEALQSARTSLDLAQTLGLRGLEGIAVVNAGEAAVSTGDWDWMQKTITETDAERLSDFDRAIVQLTESRLRTLCGEVLAAKELLHRAAPCIDSAESPQDLANLRETEAIVALTDGRLRDAIRSASQAVAADARSNYGIRSYVIAGRAALWLRDHERVEEELTRMRERGLHVAWLDWNRRTLESGLLLLDGRADEAASSYQDCAHAFKDLGCPFDLALLQLDFVTLAPDHLEARAGADEAREIFERLGAKPFLERLEAALSSASEV